MNVDDWFSSTGVRQRLPWTAGTWSVSWDTARSATDNPISSYDPSLQAGLQVAYSQPLLRDRAIDAARAQYIIAKRNQESSDLRFRETAVQTVAAVKQAYWTLKATLANVTVQQRSLDLARELARENKIRVDAGQLPPLDLVQAEAEVASRREGLIRARTAAEDAEDALRRLIVDPDDVAFWRVRLDPVEQPAPVGPAPDVDAVVARALTDRYDLARAGRDLENARTNVQFLSNQRLPDVRLEASYRGSGLGGTQFLRDGGFPGIITGTRSRGLADALGQAFTNDYPTWSLGLTISYPLGRSYEARQPGARRSRAAPGGAADRKPAHPGRRDDPQGRPADSKRRGARRRGARRRDARAAAARVRAAALRRGAVDDIPRHAGAARSARGAGQSAADIARSRIGAREFRSRPAGRPGRRRRATGTERSVVALPTAQPRGIFRSGGE